MSLVGPRPERPEFVKDLRARFRSTASGTWCARA
jgi:lipopolysaccharide/colanic/teichoic acid biosynthesis glycosyltransferase